MFLMQKHYVAHVQQNPLTAKIGNGKAVRLMALLWRHGLPPKEFCAGLHNVNATDVSVKCKCVYAKCNHIFTAYQQPVRIIAQASWAARKIVTNAEAATARGRNNEAKRAKWKELATAKNPLGHAIAEGTLSSTSGCKTSETPIRLRNEGHNYAPEAQVRYRSPNSRCSSEGIHHFKNAFADHPFSSVHNRLLAR